MHHSILTARLLVCIIVLWALPQLVVAQNDSDKEKLKERSSKTLLLLEQFDKNKDGQIEASEIPDFARKSLEKMASKHGMDVNKGFSIEKLVKAEEERKEEKTESKGESNQPIVPTFGGAVATPLAPGFSVPLATSSFQGLEEMYDPKVLEHMQKEVLPRYDRNKDGMLQIEDETKDGRWNPDLADSDKNKDGVLDKAELLERYAKKFNLPRKDYAVSSSAGGSNSSSSGTSGSSSLDKVREYARGLLNRYDRSKNGFLEKDEWQEMKSEHHAADVNKDNVITLDELTNKLAGYATSPSPTTTATASTPTPSPSSSSGYSSSRRPWSSSSSSSSKPSEKKSSYRFLTPTERLPKGLPDWFARNDGNGDGQIMMAEYTTAWNEAAVVEFNKYDLNSDGTITPEECLEVEKAKKSLK